MECSAVLCFQTVPWSRAACRAFASVHDLMLSSSPAARPLERGNNILVSRVLYLLTYSGESDMFALPQCFDNRYMFLQEHYQRDNRYRQLALVQPVVPQS